MSGEKKHFQAFSKNPTGTVPKTKLRGCRRSHTNDSSSSNLSNNLLGSECRSRQEFPTQSRFAANGNVLNPYPVTEQHNCFPQNSLAHANYLNSMPGNGDDDDDDKVFGSGRDSLDVVSKCEKAKKFPDKKQIENKLNQIREYLRVTASLMSTIERRSSSSTSSTTEDQAAAESERRNLEIMIVNLQDSETKLLALLNNSNCYDDDGVLEEMTVVDARTVEENRNMDVAVSEHVQRFSQLLDVLSCQQKKLDNVYHTNSTRMENGDETSRHREAAACGYKRNKLEQEVERTTRIARTSKEQQNASIKLMNRKTENQLGNAQVAQQQKGNSLPEPEETTCKEEQQQSNDHESEDRFDATIKELEDRLNGLRFAVGIDGRPDVYFLQERLEGSDRLLHLLDATDARLHSEHEELQGRLNELQTKKAHVDKLVDELQNLDHDGDGDGDDVDDEDIGMQVRKIVSMKHDLTKLKDMLESVKSGQVAKTDNLRHGLKTNRGQVSERVGNNSVRAEVQRLHKLSNKSLMSIRQREKVLEELKTKKRELEEVMYKQKDCISLNNDVCSEATAAAVAPRPATASWLSAPIPPHRHVRSSCTYSSDEGDITEDRHGSFSNLDGPAVRRPGTGFSVGLEEFDGCDPFSNGVRERNVLSSHVLRRSPERSNTITTERRGTPRSPGERSAAVTDETCGCRTDRDDSVQMQRRSDSIRSVCRSMEDLQGSQQNGQLSQNKLTQAPLRAELPRPYFVSDRDLLDGDEPSFDHRNDDMLTASTLQTQAFLLNTLSQCCQTLWCQQREIASLKNTVRAMREDGTWRRRHRERRDGNVAPPALTSPRRSDRRGPPPLPRTPAKENHMYVAAACSLPNLNHAHPNVEGVSRCARHEPNSTTTTTTTTRNVVGSGRAAAILSRNRTLINDLPNNSVNVNVNANADHRLASQVWNGQALNNQVAPGNRANNYWDNFRSYSRQNLLSTASKSNEGLQSCSGMNNYSTACERSPSYSLPPFHVLPKPKTVYNKSSSSSSAASSSSSSSSSSSTSTNRSEDGNTLPRQHHRPDNVDDDVNVSCNKATRVVSPDVLNIDRNSNTVPKLHDNFELLAAQTTAIPFFNQARSLRSESLQLESSSDVCSTRSNVSQGAACGNKNEWHVVDDDDDDDDDDHHHHEQRQTVDTHKSSKSFDELRDNLYKEVADLISANENRPHYLIQLFKDLRHIDSDPLRGRTLRSIRTVLSNSQLSERGTSRPQSVDVAEDKDGQVLLLRPTIWSVPVLSPTSHETLAVECKANSMDSTVRGILKKIVPFLKAHKEDVFRHELKEMLGDAIIEAMPLPQLFANTSNIQDRSSRTSYRRFVAAALYAAFERFQERRIGDVKKELMKTIADVIPVALVQDETSISQIGENDAAPLGSTNLLPALPDTTSTTVFEGDVPLPMQNDDLAEADQTGIQGEHEGAFGGMEVHDEGNSDEWDSAKTDSPVKAEEDAVKFTEQGLDRIPTRLDSKH